MFGAIIGDIAGSAYEFNNTGDYHCDLFTVISNYTDDTIMTMAVASWLLRFPEITPKALEEEMVRIANDFRFPKGGYGRNFRKWLFGTVDRKPYDSWGNGSAMRVSPVAWAAGSLEEALRYSDAVTAVTHDHPEGLKGARAAAACVYLARTGASKEAIRDHVREYYYPLKETLAEIRPGYSFDVTCQGAVPQAIQAFLEAESFEDAIRNAISLGGDSDTQAAIAGSIAAPFFGVPRAMREKALTFLPEDLKAILEAFEARFGAEKTID